MKKNYDENEVNIDPKKFINKKKDFRFMFFSSWNQNKLKKDHAKLLKGLKIASLVVLPLSAIALGTTLGILSSLNDDNDGFVNQVVINNEVIKRRVYLISDDNYTVPLTVTLDKKNNVHEEMLDVINLLKVSSKASNEYLHGFLPDELKVNSFTNDKDYNLTIDFSKEFNEIQNVDEMRMFEALNSSLLQFENVKTVSISVEGEKLENIPNVNTLMDNQDFPLNTIGHRPSLLENKELVTVFYQREYDQNNKYLIPVSLYAEVGASSNITFVNALFKELPSNYQLNNLQLYESISKNQQEEDNFSLTVNSYALVDESTVNKDLYDIVLLSLDLMGREEKVNFEIEGETLMVEGIYSEEDIPVSSIYYNETQI